MRRAERSLANLSLVAVVAVAVAASGPSMAQGTAQEEGVARTLERSDKDMRMVLEKLQQLGAKPVHTLTVEQARKQPSPADAAKALEQAQARPARAHSVARQNTSYPGATATQAARLFIPAEAAGSSGTEQRPVILYFHGGGWVVADMDTYQASATALAEKTGAIVVAVEYRQGPEHAFPAAHQDAFAAYHWVLENAARWGGDAARIAVAGESAGGNLAINVAINARDSRQTPPVHMLLVYPVAGTSMETASYRENASAIPLGRQDMRWFFEKVLAGRADRESPMLDLVGRANLKGLPSATVITAEIDPLRSEGEELADMLEKAGSQMSHQNYDGVTHEFFGMASVVAKAATAQDFAAGALKRVFDASAATGVSGGASPR